MGRKPRAALVWLLGLGLSLAAVSVHAQTVSAGAAGAGGTAGAERPIVPLNLMQGIAQAQSTATPLFVMLTRSTCGNCNHLKKRLTSDATVQAALQGYVVVDVDVDSPLAAQWRSRYPSPGTTLPFVYVVAANGQGIKSAAGVQRGEDLPTMLTEARAAAEEIHQAAGLNRKKKKGKSRPDEIPDEIAAKDADGEAATAESSDMPPEKKTPRVKPPAPRKVDPLKRAESYLSVARVFAESRPEKAREYAQKAIAAAPDTFIATEAQRLLDGLK